MSEHTEHITHQPEQTGQSQPTQGDKSAVIAIYDTHSEAEAATATLKSRAST